MRRNKPNSRDFGLHNSGAGKGDKERSTKWREHYDEVEWPNGGRLPKAFRKVYGTLRNPVKL